MKITIFQQKVYKVVSMIPEGRVMTYKGVAITIGRPKAYRAVGNALTKNPVLGKLKVGQVLIPCHRVVCSNGKVGGYVLGTKKKVELLRKESDY